MISLTTLAAGLLTAVSFTTAAPTPPPKPIASAKIFADNFPSIGIRIGDSNDTLKVVLDTGSMELWVDPAKLKHPSTTTHLTNQEFSITYGMGSCSGHVAADEIHIGLLNQLDLKPSRHFGIADTKITDQNVDGIIGVSLYDPATQTYPGGWDMLAPQLKPRVFGLRMQHPLPGVSVGADDAVGQIDWGAPDPKYVQQGITYTPVLPDKVKSGWYITTHGTHVNGQPTGLGPKLTFLDTGSTGMNLLPADAAKVVKLLGGKSVPSDKKGQPDSFVLPCDMGNSTLEFEIEGTLFAVPNYLLIGSPTPSDKTMCSSWIQGTSTNNWLLGSGFLQAVYSVWDYDNKRLGFAKVPPLTYPPPPPPPKPKTTTVVSTSTVHRTSTITTSCTASATPATPATTATQAPQQTSAAPQTSAVPQDPSRGSPGAAAQESQESEESSVPPPIIIMSSNDPPPITTMSSDDSVFSDWSRGT